MFFFEPFFWGLFSESFFTVPTTLFGLLAWRMFVASRVARCTARALRWATRPWRGKVQSGVEKQCLKQ
jgi:hypothetical protein